MYSYKVTYYDLSLEEEVIESGIVSGIDLVDATKTIIEFYGKQYVKSIGNLKKISKFGIITNDDLKREGYSRY